MNKIALILILILFISCKEKPTYNPFDDQFNISVSQLVRDKYDTISAGCGYFNLTKNSGKFRPYYQIYADDFHKILAKGFTYEIDSFVIPKIHDGALMQQQMDSIRNLPFDKKTMNTELGKFGYQIIQQESDTLKIINKDTKDTIITRIRLSTNLHNRSIVRVIEYLKSKPTNH